MSVCRTVPKIFSFKEWRDLETGRRGRSKSLKTAAFDGPYTTFYWSAIVCINVKNFHGSLTTVVRAQNDSSKTANITDTIFDRKLVTGYTLTNDGVSC